ncbi:ras-related protein Rab-31-like [Saccostrea echinata]|uniref:ras-related protein Rab-31-like n=1 Tax=Saccostrea echinata TaxID=191078 RepID=UPI002A82CD60|nr:ras-related protein Rab-31-like [Saccostrea echinata]
MKSIEAKVVVLGSQAVGKTSTVIRYVGGMFSKAVSPTIGASFFTYKLTLNNYRMKLQVWDTAGQERFRSMAPMYYRKANAAMLIYDITSEDSFYDIKDWVSELKKNVDTPIVMCLVGNKNDLEESRQVNTKEAQEYAESIGALFHETSALKNIGIEEAFLQVAQQLVKLYETSPNSGLYSIDLDQSSQVQNPNESADSFHLPPNQNSTPNTANSKCAC